MTPCPYEQYRVKFSRMVRNGPENYDQNTDLDITLGKALRRDGSKGIVYRITRENVFEKYRIEIFAKIYIASLSCITYTVS